MVVGDAPDPRADRARDRLDARRPGRSGATGLREIDDAHALAGADRQQAARWPVIRPYIVSAHVAAAVEPEIMDLVDAWSEEVDRANQHWIRHQWSIDDDPATDALVEGWATLLGTGR